MLPGVGTPIGLGNGIRVAQARASGVSGPATMVTAIVPAPAQLTDRTQAAQAQN
jgi:hypothetical protein